MLHKPSSTSDGPKILDYLKARKIDLVINIPLSTERQELSDGYLIRRTAVDFGTVIWFMKLEKPRAEKKLLDPNLF